jgi:hypothetical protein
VSWGFPVSGLYGDREARLMPDWSPYP